MYKPLKKRRADLGLTQAGLACKVGTSVRHYRRIEAGEVNPSTELSLKIAEALNTTVEELWSTAANKNNNN